MFLIDKCKPKLGDEIVLHKKIFEKLKTISEDDSVPHMVFYGPSGSGKHVLINLFLEMLYGPKIYKLKECIYNVSGSGNSVTEIPIKQSPHHIIIEPNNNNFDRYLVHDVVKKYAKYTPVNAFVKAKRPFKTVFINHADKLSHYAQVSLRRTMELYSKNCRFIMVTKSLSKVIDPLISRCYSFRVQSPSNDEIFKLVCRLGAEEGIALDIDKYNEIVKHANGNIKKALWALEMQKYDLEIETSYEHAINEIVKLMHEHGVNSILAVRELLYKIIITNINGTLIISDIVNKIMENKNISLKSKFDIINSGSYYEYNLTKGRRDIMHLEAFVQNVIYTLHKESKN